MSRPKSKYDFSCWNCNREKPPPEATTRTILASTGRRDAQLDERSSWLGFRTISSGTWTVRNQLYVIPVQEIDVIASRLLLYRMRFVRRHLFRELVAKILWLSDCRSGMGRLDRTAHLEQRARDIIIKSIRNQYTVSEFLIMVTYNDRHHPTNRSTHQRRSFHGNHRNAGTLDR